MSRAILVAGLAYGDEGKGATVDYLCRRLPVDLVVRYNGGSQCAHNVVTANGVHHTFAQFGSGMLADKRVRTHLSRFMLVDPLAMMNEARALQEKTDEVWERTTVDPRCVIITPFHKHLNRTLEAARGEQRHGSCGMGVGTARDWHLRYGDAVLLAGDVVNYDKVRAKLYFMRDLLAQNIGGVHANAHFGDYEMGHLAYDYVNTWSMRVRLTEELPKSEIAVFEGAQGVLLDEKHGIAPHNTWTDCTYGNAEILCDEAGISVEDTLRIGCLRSYHTRHGAGPLRGEDAVGWTKGLAPTEQHNEENLWQGKFRTAPFDFELAKHAVNLVGGVDCLALGHLDRFAEDETTMSRFTQLVDHVVAPVGIVANGGMAYHRSVTEAFKGEL